jgi:FkbM family methyltransferase
MRLIIYIYTLLFARNIFFRLNRFLFKISTHGLGIGNYTNHLISGEKYFISRLVKSNNLKNGVIFDIGANKGDYSKFIRNNKVDIPIYAFEPHPSTFKVLIDSTLHLINFNAINKGLGVTQMISKIYDYKNNEGSQHASIYKDVIEKIHNSEAKETSIEIITIDDFIDEYKISEISLLKIDTEGNELDVILGAKKSIEKGLVNIIQFEFNSMNVISRTYLKDFINLLPEYKFYRLLPFELLPIIEYNELNHELFGFQNIIAIKK